MSSTKRLMAVALLPVFFVAGCGGSSSSSKSSTTTSTSSTSSMASPATNGNLDDVKVDTKNPAKPTVSIPANKLPFGMASASPKVLQAGTGKTIGAKDLVHANIVIVDGTNGKTLGSSSGTSAPGIYLGDPNTMPGLVKALVGQKVGSRILVSIPPSQGLGAAGNQQSGIGANDNLVFYLDVKSTEPADKACDTPSSDPSLPHVTVPSGKGAEAKITFPKGKAAPTALTCSILKEGTGATVKAGQTISVVYTGQIWNGAVFDSTAKHKSGGKSSDFAIGQDQVIAGWDHTLVGKKVGSRVLIVVPPSAGYGSAGNAQAGIKGTDTLVFVVDILAAK